MAHIYIITNRLNQKLYIGKTVLSIDERFKEHLYRAKCGSHNHLPLYAAFSKYGIDQFIVEEKEEIEIEYLDERESFWIKELNTVSPNGYNLTLGGDGTVYHDRVEILKLFELDLSFADIVRISKASEQTIYRIEEEYGVKPRINNLHKFRTIYMFDLEGNFVQEFESVVKAVEFLQDSGISLSINSAKNNILRCCRKEPKRKTAYKHIWRYTPEL